MPTAGTQPWSWGSPPGTPSCTGKPWSKACCSGASGPALPGSERRGLFTAFSHGWCCVGQALGLVAHRGPFQAGEACGSTPAPTHTSQTSRWRRLGAVPCPPTQKHPACIFSHHKDRVNGSCPSSRLALSKKLRLKQAQDPSQKWALLQLSASSCILRPYQQGGMRLSGTEPPGANPPLQNATHLCSTPAIKMPSEKSSPPAAPPARCELLCKAALLQCFSCVSGSSWSLAGGLQHVMVSKGLRAVPSQSCHQAWGCVTAEQSEAFPPATAQSALVGSEGQSCDLWGSWKHCKH